MILLIAYTSFFKSIFSFSIFLFYQKTLVEIRATQEMQQGRKYSFRMKVPQFFLPLENKLKNK